MRSFSRSWRERGKAAADLAGESDWSTAFASDFEAGLILFALAVVAVLVVVPLFLFGLELIVLGWVLASGVIGRLVLHRPWVIEARVSDRSGRVLQWQASGWRASNRLIEEVASDLAAGRELPGTPTGERAQPR